jgi:gas vesicle protein
MDPVIAGLMGTIIGGVFGILGGILTGRRQAKLEREKWFQTRKDDVDKETRLAVAELTRNMAAATQVMLWFTAKATTTPDKVTQKDVSDYDKEIQERLPDILGSLCVVSALDPKISARMSPLMGDIYSVDAQIAQACKGLDEYPDEI